MYGENGWMVSGEIGECCCLMKTNGAWTNALNRLQINY